MYIFEQAFFTAIYARRLQKKNNSGRVNAVFLCLFALSAALFQWVYINNGTLIAESTKNRLYTCLSSFFFCGVVSFIMMLWVYSVARVSVMEALYAATLAYLSEHTAYCVRIIASAMMGDKAAGETGA